MDDDDDEDSFYCEYESGFWTWNDREQSLAFVSDLPPPTESFIELNVRAPTGKIEFRKIDLLEQVRFRKRFGRKPEPWQPDVITLQDVKDLVLYMAPTKFLSPSLINLLHLPTTERFLRALILYCTYYLQIAEEMSKRLLELDNKIRTPECIVVETEFRENLSDLRLLVAKEYCNMLVGADDMKNFHHMGPDKKSKSLSDKDARFMETLLRMSVELVWIALNRESFQIIEVEIHRLFKSDAFNSVEREMEKGYFSNLKKQERDVLVGNCVRSSSRLLAKSPLVDEVFCQHKTTDYRIFGLGVVKYPRLNSRLKFMLEALTLPEEQLLSNKISLGILGAPKGKFDILLTPLPAAPEPKSKSSIATSRSSRRTQKSLIKPKPYEKTEIPSKYSFDSREEEDLTESFPGEPFETIERPSTEIQRQKWMKRYISLVKQKKRSSASCTRASV